MTDRAISEHVLRMHRYRPPNQDDGEVIPLTASERLLSTHDPTVQAEAAEEAEGEAQGDSVFEEHNRILHGSGSKLEYLRLKFIQK